MNFKTVIFACLFFYSAVGARPWSLEFLVGGACGVVGLKALHVLSATNKEISNLESDIQFIGSLDEALQSIIVSGISEDALNNYKTFEKNRRDFSYQGPVQYSGGALYSVEQMVEVYIKNNTKCAAMDVIIFIDSLVGFGQWSDIHSRTRVMQAIAHYMVPDYYANPYSDKAKPFLERMLNASGRCDCGCESAEEIEESKVLEHMRSIQTYIMPKLRIQIAQRKQEMVHKRDTLSGLAVGVTFIGSVLLIRGMLPSLLQHVYS